MLRGTDALPENDWANHTTKKAVEFRDAENIDPLEKVDIDEKGAKSFLPRRTRTDEKYRRDVAATGLSIKNLENWEAIASEQSTIQCRQKKIAT